MKRTVLILLFSSISFLTFSQQEEKVWTLRQCIDYAIENNLQVEQSRLNVKSNEQGQLNAYGDLLPSVNGQASHSYNFGQTIDPYTNTFANDWTQSNNFRIGANWTLFNGMRNINNVKKNQLDVMASKQALETAENEISLQVTSAFMDVLFNREQLKVAQSQLEITREQTERTRKLYNAGSVAQGELLNIEAQLAQEEVNKINRENNLNLAVLSLKQLLRIPSSEPFEIVSPETFDADQLQMPNQSQSIIETALNNYPSIQQRETEVESAEMQISLAKGMLSPTISLSGGLATGYSGLRTEVVSVQPGSPREIGYVSGSNQPVLTQTFNQELRDVPFFDQLDNNLNRNVGFSMSIPIFNNFSTLTSINRAEIQRDMAQTRLKQEKQTVTQDIERAYADAMASFKRYQASKKSVQSLETAFDYSEKRFDVGMINAVDYNTAKNNLTQAKSDLLRAKYEYLFRLKVLDFYQGNQIAFE